MNCKNCEAILVDLARKQIVEIAAQEAALGHVEQCPACADRFIDETTLTVELRSYAAETKVQRTSIAVENTLLQAFRDSLSGAPKPVVVSISSAPAHIRRGWSRWVIAAAAIIVIALTLIVIRIQRVSSAGTGEKDKTSKRSVAPVAPQDNKLPEALPTPETTVANNGSPHRRTEKRVRYAGKSPENTRDFTSDFILLNIVNDYAPLENGRILRVEVQRSALIAMGLPMNVARADEAVKADLLVGQDGIARAIRFVQ